MVNCFTLLVIHFGQNNVLDYFVFLLLGIMQAAVSENSFHISELRMNIIMPV